MRGIESRIKKYVEVIARHTSDGGMIPLRVVWDDGTVYEIDRVLDKRRAASLKVGGTGTRYLVQIGGKDTYLFYEGPHWFVEAIVKEAM